MSLLNDALKRAEVDKSSNTFEPSEQLPDLTPVDEGGGRGKMRLPVLVAIALVLAAGAGWYFTHTGEDAVPSTATAQDPRLVQTPATTPPAPPAAFMNRPRRAGPEETTLASAPPAKTDEPAKPAMAEQSRPEKTPAAQTPALAKADAAKPQVPAQPGVEDWDDDKPAPAAAPPPAQPAGETVAAAPAEEPKPPAEESAKPAAEEPVQPKPAAKKPKLDASKFDLSGIMEGPDGKTAIINGLFVTVGQTVDGAKVTAIGSQTAELEADGQKIRLRFGAE